MKTMQLQMRAKRSGSTLIAVMGLAMLISMTIVCIVSAGRRQIDLTRMMGDQIKARMLAEAGANDAYNYLKTNFGAWTDSSKFTNTLFEGGSYHASVISPANQRLLITCTGHCKRVIRDNLTNDLMAIVKLDLTNCPIVVTNAAPTIGTSPFGCTVLAGGYIDWAGNADIRTSNSWMHANGIYTANGINKVYANVSSHTAIQMVGGAGIYGIGRAPSITGGYVATNVVTDVPLISIPNVDLTPYYNAALANGQVYNSNKSISGTVAPAGGIMWVNGTLSFGNGTYTGCFIATGGVEIKTTGNGTVTLVKVNRYPLLVSRDADILVKQAKMLTFRGLIYCKTGSFDKQGNGDVNGRGTIIAAGNFTKNGGWAGMIYEDSTPVPPGGSYIQSSDRLIITAWQE